MNLLKPTLWRIELVPCALQGERSITKQEKVENRLDDIGSDQFRSDKTSLVKIRLDWTALHGLDWSGLEWSELDWSGLEWSGLVEIGLVLIGLV